MDRGVCEHAVPLALRCERCLQRLGVTARILMREFGSARAAIAYADRKASGSTSIAQDYIQAAQQLRVVFHDAL
jgi:hypothetical protein